MVLRNRAFNETYLLALIINLVVVCHTTCSDRSDNTCGGGLPRKGLALDDVFRVFLSGRRPVGCRCS